jgi:exosome complex component MTR3
VLISRSSLINLSQSVVGKEIWLDPTEEEAQHSNGTLVLACMPALQKITSVWQTGEMKVADVMGVRSLLFDTFRY